MALLLHLPDDSMCGTHTGSSSSLGHQDQYVAQSTGHLGGEAGSQEPWKKWSDGQRSPVGGLSMGTKRNSLYLRLLLGPPRDSCLVADQPSLGASYLPTQKPAPSSLASNKMKPISSRKCLTHWGMLSGVCLYQPTWYGASSTESSAQLCPA